MILDMCMIWEYFGICTLFLGNDDLRHEHDVRVFCSILILEYDDHILYHGYDVKVLWNPLILGNDDLRHEYDVRELWNRLVLANDDLRHQYDVRVFFETHYP